MLNCTSQFSPWSPKAILQCQSFATIASVFRGFASYSVSGLCFNELKLPGTCALDEGHINCIRNFVKHLCRNLHNPMLSFLKKKWNVDTIYLHFRIDCQEVRWDLKDWTRGKQELGSRGDATSHSISISGLRLLAQWHISVASVMVVFPGDGES